MDQVKGHYVCLRKKGKLYFVIADGGKFYLADKNELVPITFFDFLKICAGLSKDKYKAIGFGEFAKGHLFKNNSERKVV